MADDEQQDPIDQLIDLFVYAPVGLLYEYQDVYPRLVRRGKSQVQLARVIGKLAAGRGKDGPAATAGQVGELVSLLVARGLTDLGEVLGLAPPSGDRRPSTTAPPPPPSAHDRTDGANGERPQLTGGEPQSPMARHEGSEAEAEVEVGYERPLPIAGYDELTAKVIIPLLDDLTSEELTRIRAHEEANRARKTVLGKLDRLGA